MYGTTRPIVKRAILDGLNAQTGLANVALRYALNTDAVNLVADDGTRDAIWLDEPDTEGIEVDPNMRAAPHDSDEEYDVVVHVQCIRDESDGTQEVCDLRAAEILGEVKRLLQSATVLVPVSANFPYCTVTSSGNLSQLGVIGAGHGTHYALSVHVKARIALS